MEGHRSDHATALTALRYTERQTPTDRRFGKEADAAWRGLECSLSTADRVERSLRSVAGQRHTAFDAHSVFALRAVAEDGARQRAPLRRVGGT